MKYLIILSIVLFLGCDQEPAVDLFAETVIQGKELKRISSIHLGADGYVRIFQKGDCVPSRVFKNGYEFINRDGSCKFYGIKE